MKTARFTTIVKTCGSPEVHLLLTDPAQDRLFQRAIKESRVLTVFQPSIGTKTDRGKVAFEPGTNREFLIFPKSLKLFSGAEVVGIKYDLLKETELPKSQRAPIAPLRKPKRTKPPRQPRKPRAELPEIITFPAASDEREETEQAEAVTEIKKQIRRAMAALEDGKQVAAFNLLKKILDP